MLQQDLIGSPGVDFGSSMVLPRGLEQPTQTNGSRSLHVVRAEDCEVDRDCLLNGDGRLVKTILVDQEPRIANQCWGESVIRAFVDATHELDTLVVQRLNRCTITDSLFRNGKLEQTARELLVAAGVGVQQAQSGW